jgi:signal transduction histidine kinase
MAPSTNSSTRIFRPSTTQANTLLNLINDVLDLSKIEAGKMELAIEEINITDTINSVMSTASGLVKDKPVRLKKKSQQTFPPFALMPCAFARS